MRILTISIVFLFFKAELSWSQLPPGFSFTNISSGWVQPMGTAFNADGTKLFVWEKAGKVYVCNWDGTTYVKQATPVLDISPEVGNWRDHGLLGFALDPNFNTNGLIYCLYVVDRHYLMNFGTGSYNAATNNYYSATIGRLTRYGTTTGGGNLTAVAGTRTILMGETKTTGSPVLYESHGVGSLAFAADGTLLVTTGEGASYDATDDGNVPATYYVQGLADGIIRANENVGSFRSQMLNSMNGKILRLDPATGNGVSSNPFYNAGSPRSPQSRVWAMGLRNPFRMSIRPNTGSSNPATADIGEIYVSDVGWFEIEELNIIKEAASNCGWPYYEGLGSQYEFSNLTTANKDEPNPLYGISGCSQQYFTFRNLLKQATDDNIHTVYNPCNPAVPISSVNDNRFFHRLPAIDWKHGPGTDSARVAVFNTNNYTIKQIGTAGSGVTGTPFAGNAAVAGCWYTGTLFPPEYNNTYFMSDYGAGWIKNLTIQFTDKVQKVTGFATGFGAIIHMSQNPLDGTVFATDYANESIKRITYGGNQLPIVKLSSNLVYGPGPLTVNFTGNTSYDPDGPSVTYSWDFGDGSALNTAANPSHVFTSGNSNPKKFFVKLTVKDNLNATSVDSIIISINNTPPNVAITSPLNNSFYQLGSDTAYSLLANVTDAEHRSYELSYSWQTILRHNSHIHPEPVDTDKITTTQISRIGCNGDTYYWFIKLTVTDPAGLSRTDSVKLFPQCGGPLPLSLISFSVSSNGGSNFLKWVTTNELNLKSFEIERSYDGANFVKIGTVNSQLSQGTNNYDFKDENFLDGYIYYRLKMVDLDGNFSRSYIIRIYSGTNAGNELTVSPNPFKNDFLFAAVFSQAGKITIRIIDTKGTVVKTIKKHVDAGFNSFQIDNLDNISKGIYFLEAIQDNNVRRTKLIKE
ncbi:MAG: PQQ-dependent sugar dehydrogenase [Ferruginibacter sp.]